MNEIKCDCPVCHQPLEAPVEMGGQTVNCPTCSTPLTIPQPARTKNQVLPPPTTSVWYYMDGAKQVGPVANAAMKDLVLAGAITAETPIWKEGHTDWLPLAQTELGALTRIATSSTQQTPPKYLPPPSISAPPRRFTWKVIVPVVGVAATLLALLLRWPHGRTGQSTDSSEALRNAVEHGDAKAQAALVSAANLSSSKPTSPLSQVAPQGDQQRLRERARALQLQINNLNTVCMALQAAILVDQNTGGAHELTGFELEKRSTYKMKRNQLQMAQNELARVNAQLSGK